ncbi:SPT16-domain-containing protein [Rhizodiscina lignyota]|uniref:FACT complex subunit n=1 Tax=Rhizodiscina lignyota TaxID=1504668 RepID=A0A9P4MEP5_9PEZI|nr:SPT16-domain-containing protein [Rhizodiscina lignyota]
MAEEIAIDKQLFHDRLSSFQSQWKADKRAGDALFNGAGSIVVCVGKANEGHYTKSAALQLWLLGYEFPSTLFVLSPEAIHIVTTKKKDREADFWLTAAYLEPLKGGKVPVEIYVRGKDAEQNAKQFETCVEVIKAGGKHVGTLPKDEASGPFVDDWKTAFEAISKEVEEVNISSALSNAALSVKDEPELRAIRDASKASAIVMQKYFVEEMSEIVDAEKKITHKALAQKVNDKLDDTKFFQKNKISSSFDPVHLDWDFLPTVQSGGNYDLKFVKDPDDHNLHAGIIVSALGLRYKSYSSLVARTYLVDPTKAQESAYKLLLQVHLEVVKALRPGAVAKDIYQKAIAAVKAKKPDLESHFVKNVGIGIGIESQDPELVLNAKNTRTLKDGMTLAITVGFSNVTNPNSQNKKSNTYSLVISDTVRVGDEGGLVFTKDAATDLETVAFFFNDEEEAPAPKKEKKQPGRSSAIAQKNTLATRLRGERTTVQNEEKERARQEHQRELHQKKQKEGLEKYGKGTGSLNGVEEKKFKRFDSYKRDDQFPTKVRELVVILDQQAQSVVCPIMGRPVPFHLNTIKNASTTNEGEFTSLRINFLSPGQGVGRKDDQPFEDASAHFIRSLTFRSKDKDRMETISNKITEMKKEIVRRENEKKQLEDVVEQDKLILAKGNRPQILDLVFLRPGFDGKRVPGRVEIHQNGLRYVHHQTNQMLEVPFSNIKHLFFQPSEHELIVIIHIHLMNPIMVGKKKSKDVQFYREATEMQFDETGNRKRRHRFNDEDEFEAEQEERKRRIALDKEFMQFAKRIADAGREYDLKVDQPFRGMSFNGVPSRSSVLMQPTTDCIIQLTEPPFTVLTMSEVEVIHLERVQFGLKNFDMVIVFKDYNRAPFHINTIPVESLETVKDWIDSIEIPYSEGPVNLQWPTIMKTVTSDPHQFYVDGGWSFLGGDDDESDEESEEESAFEMSDEELAESVSESDGESDFDENASEEASEADMSGEDSDGEDWDEMEAKAKKKDKESGLDDGDADRGKKRKR